MSNLSQGGGALVVVGRPARVRGVLLAACGKKSTGTTGNGGTPKAGGTYNYPLGANPVSIEPLSGSRSPKASQVAHQIFQGLMSTSCNLTVA